MGFIRRIDYSTVLGYHKTMNKRCTAVRFLVILTIFVCLLTPGSIRAVGSGEWVPVLWQVRPCAYFGIATDTARGRVVTNRSSHFVYGYEDGTAIWNGHRWKVTFTDSVPPDRIDSRLIYHATSGNVVGYGGFSYSVFDEETPFWLFDGADWFPIEMPEPNPGRRYYFDMAYDTHRDRLVLFGGKKEVMENGHIVGTEIKNDTWEWDGSVWHEMESLTEPPEPRWGHAMVYDEARQVTLMLGGKEDPAAICYEGTWSWDGIRWELLTETGPVKAFHRMAWDPLNQQVILFGGAYQYWASYDKSTYVWNGTSWTQIQCPGTEVKPRSGPGLAWDPINQRMMMIGGHYTPPNGDPSIYLNDMLWFDGECWQPYDLPESPIPRSYFSIAYDPIRNVTLLHGGFDNNEDVYLRDSWAWNGLTWSFAGDEPPERTDAAMAYDPINQGVLLFGGFGGYGKFYRETWLWNGEWSEINIGGSNPGDRTYHEMVFDAARNNVILFGGYSNDKNRYINDTWVWDGVTWTDVTPDGENPEPRYGHCMAYDPRFEQVVLFGGLDHDQSYNDTWVWDGRSWSNVTPAANNPDSDGYDGLSYDEKLETVLLTNIKRESRSYSWDGCNWHMLPKSIYGGVGVEARAFDSIRGRTVTFVSETWEYFQTVDLDIDLDQSLYHPGDTFDLRLTLSNELDEDRTGILLIALDVYGSLWFWPAWQPFPEYLGYEERTISPGSHSESILSFTWPETNCAADNLLFHAALLDSTEGLLIAYDNVIWGWW